MYFIKATYVDIHFLINRGILKLADRDVPQNKIMCDMQYPAPKVASNHKSKTLGTLVTRASQ